MTIFALGMCNYSPPSFVASLQIRFSENERGMVTTHNNEAKHRYRWVIEWMQLQMVTCIISNLPPNRLCGAIRTSTSMHIITHLVKQIPPPEMGRIVTGSKTQSVLTRG